VCSPCSAAKSHYYRSLLDPDEFRRRRRAEFANNRQRYRNYQVKKQFGITLEHYWEMHSAQGGLCAICGEPERELRNGRLKDLCVDHCHSTNEVRGLLCANCNKGIGNLQDSPERLRRAALYLENHRANQQREVAPPA
jgi:hypothetical protein